MKINIILWLQKKEEKLKIAWRGRKEVAKSNDGIFPNGYRHELDDTSFFSFSFETDINDDVFFNDITHM